MATFFTRLAGLALFLCAGLQAWGQSAQNQSLSPYTLGPRPAGITAKVTHIRTVRLDGNVIDKLRQAVPERLTLNLPLPDGSTASLELEGSKGISSQQRIRQTGNRIVKVDRGLHYHTPIKKEFGALSLFNLGQGQYQLSGMFTYLGKSYVIGPDSMGRQVIFPEAEMPGRNNFTCHAEELARNAAISNHRSSTGPGTPPTPQACPNSVKMFVEADYKSYQDNGSSLPRTVAWINSIWNVVARHYSNLNIPTEVVDTYIHTSQDNYLTSPIPGTNPVQFHPSTDVLDQFTNDTLSIRNYNGDLAHLLSTKPARQGGIAWLDVLCGSAPYNCAYSDVDLTFLQLPTYSWTVQVVTHEVGHNFGSNHTHWCGWEKSPGVFGAIDSCYATEDAGSGQCYGGSVPRVGTIMSYCHLNASINPALGFGPLPSAKIVSDFLAATCLTPGSGFANVSIASLDTACVGAQLKLTVTNFTGATYRWTGPNGFTSSVREPVIASFAANQAGTYNVVITNGSCVSTPYTSIITANCIGAAPLGNQVLCSGDVTAVSYHAAFTPAAGNQYQVELSMASGTFAAAPPVVGTLASTQVAGMIPVSLPFGTAAGSGYKFRVKSTFPGPMARPPMRR